MKMNDLLCIDKHTTFMETLKDTQKVTSKATEVQSVKDGLTLKQIRSALEKIEKQRAARDLSDNDRQALEEAALTLRSAERTAICDMQTGIVKGFEEQVGAVKLQTAEIKMIIARLNKVPKILDGTETAVKECVKVLRIILNWATILVLAFIIVTSCSTMSKAQIKKVNALAVTSDSVALAPSVLFGKLADVRVERGLFFAASLSETENRIKELNELFSASQTDAKTAAKADVYIKVLGSYISALKSLSSQSRPQKYETELKGIGRNMDSILIVYNKLEWGDEIETGLPRQIGKTSGYLAEQYMKRRQKYLLKQVLVSGDTLVATCCTALAELLRKNDMKQLIDNEEAGLEANFRSYLNSMQVRGSLPSENADRRYLELRKEIADARTLQSKCASALTSLKNAHHKLLEELDKGRTYTEYSDDFVEFAAQATAVKKLIASE